MVHRVWTDHLYSFVYSQLHGSLGDYLSGSLLLDGCLCQLALRVDDVILKLVFFVVLLFDRAHEDCDLR